MQHYDVIDDAGKVYLNLGRIDWADWDHNGDLVLAKDGSLCRIASDPSGRFNPDARPRTLIDLAALTFSERRPPPGAWQWRGERPAAVVLRNR